MRRGAERLERVSRRRGAVVVGRDSFGVTDTTSPQSVCGLSVRELDSGSSATLKRMGGSTRRSNGVDPGCGSPFGPAGGPRARKGPARPRLRGCLSRCRRRSYPRARQRDCQVPDVGVELVDLVRRSAEWRRTSSSDGDADEATAAMERMRRRLKDGSRRTIAQSIARTHIGVLGRNFGAKTKPTVTAMSRQQLPPQIKKIEVTDRKAGKTRCALPGYG